MWRHRANPDFWRCYRSLPPQIQIAARKHYRLLKQDPRHPSINLKRIGKRWSARVSIGYRALAVENGGELIWFWIGSHADYDRLIGKP